MIKNITKSNFRDEFVSCGRGNQFSYQGLDVIYDYLNEINPDMELDVIGICCNFTEYGSIEEMDGYDISSIEELENKTTVLRMSNGGFVIVNY